MTKNFINLKQKVLNKLHELEYFKVHYHNLDEFDIQHLKPFEDKVDDLYYFIYLTKIDKLLNLKDKIKINWMWVFNDYNINNLDRIIKQIDIKPEEVLKIEDLDRIKDIQYTLSNEDKWLLYEELLENENFTTYDNYKSLIHSDDLFQNIIDRLVEQLYSEEPYLDDDIDKVNEEAIEIFEDNEDSFKDLIELEDLSKVEMKIN